MVEYGEVVDEAIRTLNDAGIDVEPPRTVSVVEDGAGLDGEAVSYAAATDQLHVYEDALPDDETVYDAVEAGILDRWYVDQIAGAPGEAFEEAADGLEDAYRTYLDAAERFAKPFYIDTDRERFSTRFEAADMRRYGMVRQQDIVAAGIVRAAPDSFAEGVEEAAGDDNSMLQAKIAFKKGFGALVDEHEDDVVAELEPLWERDQASRQVSVDARQTLREHWDTYTATDMDAGTFRGLLGRDLAYAPFEPYEDEGDGGPTMEVADPEPVQAFFERWDAREQRVRRRSRGGRDLDAAGAFLAQRHGAADVEAAGQDGGTSARAATSDGTSSQDGFTATLRSYLGI